MAGDYDVELKVINPAHYKNFTATFNVKIWPCVVTAYSLSGPSSLPNYVVLDPLAKYPAFIALT